MKKIENLGEKHITKGNLFEIELKTRPTSGYSWEIVHDKNIVKLQNKKLVTLSPQLGASSKEILVFQAVKPGHTIIKLIYKRPWEKETKKEKSIEIFVK